MISKVIEFSSVLNFGTFNDSFQSVVQVLLSTRREVHVLELVKAPHFIQLEEKIIS